MTKPTKRKRSESEVVSEVMLRRAALAYAAVANLDPSDPRWRRCWRALSVAATGMAAEIREEAVGSPAPTPSPLPGRNARPAIRQGRSRRRSGRPERVSALPSAAAP